MRSTFTSLPENNAVDYDRAGAAQSQLHVGTLRESVAVVRRPFSSLGRLRHVEMMVGDPPQPMVLLAVLASRSRRSVLRVSQTDR